MTNSTNRNMVPHDDESTPAIARLVSRAIMVALRPCWVDSRWNALERKRKLWWFNDRRNHLLASLVKALLRVDTPALRPFGIRLGREQRRQARRGWRVCLLVESIRHATTLQRFLPGMTVLDALSNEAGAEQELQPPSHSWRSGRIITLTRAWQEGIDTDVLVHAMGDRGSLRLDSNSPQGTDVQVRTALLIDFFDPSDTRTRTDSEFRRRHYHQQGLELTTLEA